MVMKGDTTYDYNIPSSFSRNSGKKKNSGMSSFTSLLLANDERCHVVDIE